MNVSSDDRNEAEAFSDEGKVRLDEDFEVFSARF